MIWFFIFLMEQQSQIRKLLHHLRIKGKSEKTYCVGFFSALSRPLR